MAFMQHGDASIYYEEYGSGYPLTLFAPGSLQSSIEWWHESPWDPTVELASEFHVIAMDQRNAGRSRAPITANDGWRTFLSDHIALLDHLGIQQTHVMGGCIGVPFSFQLMAAQPGRVSAAILQNPSGAIQRREVNTGFNRWREQLTGHPEATDEVLDAYHENLYRNLFVYTVSRDFVCSCQIPMLILAGNDQAHPHELSVELSQLIPKMEYFDEWREGAAREVAFKRVREFLRSYTPAVSR